MLIKRNKRSFFIRIYFVISFIICILFSSFFIQSIVIRPTIPYIITSTSYRVIWNQTNDFIWFIFYLISNWTIRLFSFSLNFWIFINLQSSWSKKQIFDLKLIYRNLKLNLFFRIFFICNYITFYAYSMYLIFLNNSWTFLFVEVEIELISITSKTFVLLNYFNCISCWVNFLYLINKLILFIILRYWILRLIFYFSFFIIILFFYKFLIYLVLLFIFEFLIYLFCLQLSLNLISL
uniref:hypothetical protein n=1 Tax=Porphyridium aerugineum TaxID=2792 RepID=UPI001FCDECC6|nr:hypothetical protein MW505_mgp05 [Porphyridium aerugineum]UNJ18818.1 hypothetical protein [Porphyridium aerugineum]